LIFNSYAKLNLYLEILNKRRDGYHNLKTLFERISLSDRITVTARRDGLIRVSSDSKDIPSDASNLAYRAASLLQRKFRLKKGADIKIVKRIPVGAGLGGGSSNAATVLLALVELWKLRISRKRLVRLAACLGADVPFFIYQVPFAVSGGIGDKIKPAASLTGVKLWHLLVVPRLKVPTPHIYREWDKARLRLTRQGNDVKILTLGLKKKDFTLVNKTLFNSLETITARLYPVITGIKKELARLGCRSVLMSGSGPAVYAIFSSRKEAVSRYKQFKAKHRGWRIFLCSTMQGQAARR